MWLEYGGITTEVTNPHDIDRYKRRGWIEAKPPVLPQEEQEESQQEEKSTETKPKKVVKNG